MKIMLNKSLVLAIIVLFIGISVLPHISADKINLNQDIIIVPDDYPTIQEAIDSAENGDSIFGRESI